jgi:hypothetical protein
MKMSGNNKNEKTKPTTVEKAKIFQKNNHFSHLPKKKGSSIGFESSR